MARGSGVVRWEGVGCVSVAFGSWTAAHRGMCITSITLPSYITHCYPSSPSIAILYPPPPPHPRPTHRLGGYLLMEAGTLTVTDCHFYVTRPGMLSEKKERPFRYIYI